MSTPAKHYTPLSLYQIQDLKAKAVEAHGNTWLHHFAQDVEAHTLAQFGLTPTPVPERFVWYGSNPKGDVSL